MLGEKNDQDLFLAGHFNTSLKVFELNVGTAGIINYQDYYPEQSEKIKQTFSDEEKFFVARNIHLLPMSEFLVAHLHFYRGHTLKQIANQNDMTFKQVHLYYIKALKRLKRMQVKRFKQPRCKLRSLLSF